jgi:hypothetical protein
VKAVALFAAQASAENFGHAMGGLVAVAKLADAQVIRAYLMNARNRGGLKVIFDPPSLTPTAQTAFPLTMRSDNCRDRMVRVLDRFRNVAEFEFPSQALGRSRFWAVSELA